MNKKIFRIILIPALLIIGGYFFIRFTLRSSINKNEENVALPASDTSLLKQSSVLDLRPLFITRLQQVVAKSSNGLYALSVTDMKVDVLNSTVSLENVSIIPAKEVLASLIKKGQAPNDVFTVSLKIFTIEGVNLDDAISSKTMDYKLVKLLNPVIEIRHAKQKPPAKKGGDFTERFLKEMEKLSINKVIIEGASVIHYNDDKKGKQTKLSDFAITMNNLLIDSSIRNDKDRFLFAKEAIVSFKNFSTTAGFYNLKIGSVIIKAPQQTAAIQNFSFKSELSKEAFQKKFKTRKEMYSLSIPSLGLSEMNWWDILNEERFEAGNITVSDAKLDVYLDRRPPPGLAMGNFPNQMLMKMPLKIDVSKIRCQNMEVTYTEYNPRSEQKGTIILDGLNMTIAGVTNNSQKMTAAKKMTITASARFMRSLPITADFGLDMKNHKKGAFSAFLSLKGFDREKVNSFAEPLGLVRVDEGMLQKVDVKVTGDETRANSEVLVLYNDLKVSLLEKDNGKKALDKKDVTSFIANLFVIKNDNRKGDDTPRIERGEFTRNPQAGFLNLVWKAGLVGILKSVGVPAKLAQTKQ